MEQQSISISKAGIITSLQARCAVMAAANPIGGRYDASKTFAENVDLTDPILSRFDCICVVRDVVDPDDDARLAEFVVESHTRSHPDADPEEEGAKASMATGPIDQTLLRKYIMYARQNVRPALQSIDEEKIKGVYSELRRESASGGVHIAVRHIESIIRMAEASARMHLRGQVRSDDVDLAISVLLESVIKSQKYAVSREMRRKFGKYLSHKHDVNELLLFHLHRCFRQSHALHSLRRPSGADDVDEDGRGAGDVVYVAEGDFEHTANELHVTDLTPFYSSTLFTGGSNQLHGFRRVAGAMGQAVIVRAAEAAAFKAQVDASKRAAREAAAAAEEEASRADEQAAEETVAGEAEDELVQANEAVLDEEGGGASDPGDLDEELHSVEDSAAALDGVSMVDDASHDGSAGDADEDDA